MQGKMNDQKFRENFQKIAYPMIMDKEAPNALERIRYKLQKRRLRNCNIFPTPPNTSVLQGTPNYGARCAFANFKAMKTATTPRVQSAGFSPIWNRWTPRPRRGCHRALLPLPSRTGLLS